MLIYFYVLAISVLSVFIAQKKQSVITSRILLGITFTILVLCAGLRDRTIGTDTGSYVGFFSNIKYFGDVVDIGSKMQEYGFWTLIWLVHFISNEYVFFLTAIALICVGCYQWAIVSYSSNRLVSFFIYICTLYTACFNGARQAIACAIFSLALGPLLNRNFIKYFGIIILAFLFHKTAILMLPVYFIVNRPNSLKNNVLIIMLGCMIVFFASELLEVAARFEPRYAEYGVRGAGGGYLMLAFSVSNFIFFFIYKKFVRNDRARYDCFLNMYMLGILIGLGSAVMGTNPSGIFRLRYYLTYSNIFIWPIIINNLNTRLSKFFVGYSVGVIYTIFFILTTIAFSDLVPYKFNPSIGW